MTQGATAKLSPLMIQGGIEGGLANAFRFGDDLTSPLDYSLRETFAKPLGFPRERGKCPKDKGGSKRNALTTPLQFPLGSSRGRVLQRSPLRENDGSFAKVSGQAVTRLTLVLD